MLTQDQLKVLREITKTFVGRLYQENSHNHELVIAAIASVFDNTLFDNLKNTPNHAIKGIEIIEEIRSLLNSPERIFPQHSVQLPLSSTGTMYLDTSYVPLNQTPPKPSDIVQGFSLSLVNEVTSKVQENLVYLSQELNKKNQELAKKTKENKEYNDVINDLLNDEKKLRAEKENLERIIQQRNFQPQTTDINNLLAQLNNLRSNVASLSQANTYLATQNTSLQQENLSVTNQYNQLLQEKSSLSQLVAQKEVELTTVRDNNTSLENKLKISQAHVEKYFHEMSQLRDGNSQLKSDNTELRKKLVSQSTTLEAQADEIIRLQKIIERLGNDRDSQKTVITELEDNLHVQRSKSAKEIGNFRLQNEKLANKVQALEQTNAGLTVELNQSKFERETSEKLVRELTSQLGQQVLLEQREIQSQTQRTSQFNTNAVLFPGSPVTEQSKDSKPFANITYKPQGRN